MTIPCPISKKGLDGRDEPPWPAWIHRRCHVVGEAFDALCAARSTLESLRDTNVDVPIEPSMAFTATLPSYRRSAVSTCTTPSRTADCAFYRRSGKRQCAARQARADSERLPGIHRSTCAAVHGPEAKGSSCRSSSKNVVASSRCDRPGLQ